MALYGAAEEPRPFKTITWNTFYALALTCHCGTPMLGARFLIRTRTSQ
jgi:hypothetical protein